MAVVNHWPGCDRTAVGTCASTAWFTQANSCAGAPPAGTSLATYLRCQAASKGLHDTACVEIAWENDGDVTNDGKAGSPVRVRVKSDFNFLPILEIGQIELRGEATMRLEQDATHVVTTVCP